MQVEVVEHVLWKYFNSCPSGIDLIIWMKKCDDLIKDYNYKFKSIGQSDMFLTYYGAICPGEANKIHILSYFDSSINT